MGRKKGGRVGEVGFSGGEEGLGLRKGGVGRGDGWGWTRRAM